MGSGLPKNNGNPRTPSKPHGRGRSPPVPLTESPKNRTAARSAAVHLHPRDARVSQSHWDIKKAQSTNPCTQNRTAARSAAVLLHPRDARVSQSHWDIKKPKAQIPAPKTARRREAPPCFFIPAMLA